MLAIRSEQVDLLEDCAADDFAVRGARHVRTHFPDLAEDIGPDGLHQLARRALGRGSLYGLHNERHVLALLNFMAVFGSDFDVDPDLPESATAAALLADWNLLPDERIEQVFALLAPRLGGV